MTSILKIIYEKYWPSFPIVSLLSFNSFFCCWNYVMWLGNQPPQLNYLDSLLINGTKIYCKKELSDFCYIQIKSSDFSITKHSQMTLMQ